MNTGDAANGATTGDRVRLTMFPGIFKVQEIARPSENLSWQRGTPSVTLESAVYSNDHRQNHEYRAGSVSSAQVSSNGGSNHGSEESQQGSLQVVSQAVI